MIYYSCRPGSSLLYRMGWANVEESFFFIPSEQLGHVKLSWYKCQCAAFTCEIWACCNAVHFHSQLPGCYQLVGLTSTSCARIKVISAVLLSGSPVWVHAYLWSSPHCWPSSHDELVSVGLPRHHNEALELSSGAITPVHNDHESMKLYRCPVEELIMGNMKSLWE